VLPVFFEHRDFKERASMAGKAPRLKETYKEKLLEQKLKKMLFY